MRLGLRTQRPKRGNGSRPAATRTALDAATGDELSTYDPEVDKQWGRYACCDVVNRGVAVWRDVVYVGSLDGYLHAIDAATGESSMRRIRGSRSSTCIWKTDTLIGRAERVPYTITGAPLVADDAIVIGNSGADFGVRGSSLPWISR